MGYSYDFVIVGGGMNGVNLATHFLQEGVPANKISIIDRHHSPISLWFEMTRQVGMEQVRSPLMHHLGGKDDSLHTFISTADKQAVANPYDPSDPYKRPCLRVFNEYLRNIIAKYRIGDVFQQGDVVGAEPQADGSFVLHKKNSDTQEIESPRANHLILAVGYHDNRYIPAWNRKIDAKDTLCERDLQRIRWIEDLKHAGANVHHIYEADFDVDKLTNKESTIVVGGGFSGVQLALKLVEKKNKDVVLLIEYPIEVHYFDADPAWADFSSSDMASFARMDLAERRKTIQEARNQGSISPELKRQLDRAIGKGDIRLVLGDTETAQYKNNKITLHIKLKDDSYLNVSTDRVVLATGYRLNVRPGGAWIDTLEKELNLPTHDGYPVLNDKTLQWGKSHQLYVAGQLAELSLGPLARNIAGTQLSAHRIKNAPAIRKTIRLRKAAKGMFKKTILVTGGSGYVGSIFVDYYAKQHPDHQVIVVARNKRSYLHFPSNVRIVTADYGDQKKMKRILQKHHVRQVVHIAADLNNEGAKDNITKSKALLDAMSETGVDEIVYSSTFMVYDRPAEGFDGKMSEEFPTKPSSAQNYAESKYAVEEMIVSRKNLKAVIFRYAIVIGSSEDRQLGDSRKSQGIITTYLRAASESSEVTMFDDGSAARDYVDVRDVACATDKALAWIEQQTSHSTITLNVGTGKTHTINDVVQAIEHVAGKTIKVNRSSNPPGVPVSYLDISLIRKTLGWEPTVTFDESIKNAWQFYTRSS